MKEFEGIWQPDHPEVRPNYDHVNKEFIKYEDKWATFKVAKTYNGIVGNDSQPKETGQRFLDAIKHYFPYILNKIEVFKRNDEVGGPFIYEYDDGTIISPGTLAYMYVVGDLEKYFGKLSPITRIVEIGPGYGGLCVTTLLHQLISTYAIIDLPDSLKVVNKYLSHFPDLLENTYVDLYNTNGIPTGVPYDIAISSYCLTELDDVGVNFYVDNIIKNCNGCYIESNFNCTPLVARRNLGRQDALIARLEDIFDEVLVINIQDEFKDFMTDRGPFSTQKIIGRNK